MIVRFVIVWFVYAIKPRYRFLFSPKKLKHMYQISFISIFFFEKVASWKTMWNLQKLLNLFFGMSQDLAWIWLCKFSLYGLLKVLCHLEVVGPLFFINLVLKCKTHLLFHCYLPGQGLIIWWKISIVLLWTTVYN